MRQPAAKSIPRLDAEPVVVQVRIPRPRKPPRSPWNARLAVVLSRIAGGESLREIGLRTQTNSETVRRYLRDGNPCARFLARFCQAYDVSSDAVLGLNPKPRTRRLNLRIGATSAARTSPPKNARESFKGLTGPASLEQVEAAVHAVVLPDSPQGSQPPAAAHGPGARVDLNGVTVGGST